MSDPLETERKEGEGVLAGVVPDAVPEGLSRVLPPFWFFISCAAMISIHYAFPQPAVVPGPYRLAGWFILAAAVCFAVAGKRQFDLVGTPVKPFTESKTLVTTGPFRFTRNPMYLAMVIGLMGLFVGLGTLAPLIVVPVFVWLMTSYFIVHEERILEQRFGDDYTRYKATVRRWL